jgi:hypothetical protein
MRLPGTLLFLSLAVTILPLCSAQENRNPISPNNVLMHNAMIKGDTETMKLLLDKGAVKLDGWVGFGNIQTWVEDACFSASPGAFEFLLQRRPDALRPDTANPTFPKLKPANALAWCFGPGATRTTADSADVFRIFIRYFDEQVKKTADAAKTLNEQVTMAGGISSLIYSATQNTHDSTCLLKVTWRVNSEHEITEFEREENWKTFLSKRAQFNPACVEYLTNELEKRDKVAAPK